MSKVVVPVGAHFFCYIGDFEKVQTPICLLQRRHIEFGYPEEKTAAVPVASTLRRARQRGWRGAAHQMLQSRGRGASTASDGGSWSAMAKFGGGSDHDGSCERLRWLGGAATCGGQPQAGAATLSAIAARGIRLSQGRCSGCNARMRNRCPSEKKGDEIKRFVGSNLRVVA